MFNVNILEEGRKIIGELIIDSYFFEPSKYDYAFYLYKDTEVVDKAWYSKDEKVFFEKKGYGVYYVKVFIRDIECGDKRTFMSEKIIINVDAT